MVILRFLPLSWKAVNNMADFHLIEVPKFNLLALAEIFPKKEWFFLDSSLSPSTYGRYSFLGFNPEFTVKSTGNLIIKAKDDLEEKFYIPPFTYLKSVLAKIKKPSVNLPFPFKGGFVGYFAYDLGRTLEVLPSTAVDDLNLYDFYLGYYDTFVAVDHINDRYYAVSYQEDKLQELLGYIEKSREFEVKPPTYPPAGEFSSNFTRENYEEIVRRAIEYIKAGDIFVVNLSQRFTTDFNGDPWELYKHLRKINPATFAAYLYYPEFSVLSSSPERFLELRSGKVQTRPIKGTRPRGKTIAEDLANRDELYNSQKDRAELTMIVDLERNDLGKVAKVGTVKVPELYVLEQYATVYHLVSTVTAELAEGKDAIDLLAATFPGGSITGAPKIRAMEIIEELEGLRRGIYTGCIGYIDVNGDMDLNIVIRTILVKNKKAYFGVGGGITVDSDPTAEYLETLDKAYALKKALKLLG